MRGASWFLVALLALPLAAAQPPTQLVACRAPVVTVQDAPSFFDPAGTTTLLFAIENPNGPSVDAVRAVVTTTAPAGWSAVPAQRELSMRPNDTLVNALAVNAPNRGSGQAAGNITLLVTFFCTSGEIQTTASSSAAFGVRIAQFGVPWPVVLAAFGIVAVGVVLMAFRRLRRGVVLVAQSSQRPVEPGKSAKFTFFVENRRGKPQSFAFLASGLPEGWSAHLALDQVDLEPGEEKTLWAILKAPAEALPGTEADVLVRLESARGSRESVSTRVKARVVAESA